MHVKRLAMVQCNCHISPDYNQLVHMFLSLDTKSSTVMKLQTKNATKQHRVRTEI